MAEVERYRERRLSMYDHNRYRDLYVENRKRKSDINLEFIVTKLKKSKCYDYYHRDKKESFENVCSSESRSKLFLPFGSTHKPISDNTDKDIQSKFSSLFANYSWYDMNDNSKIFSEKSNFLQQLEEKHNQEYLSTLTVENDVNKYIDIEGTNIRVSDNNEELKDDKILETKCDKCHKRFYRRSQLLRHLSNHVMHECKECHAVFYCVKTYKKHMVTHESYPCEFCDEEFTDPSLWYHHRAKHTMVECTSCEMIFYNKTALTKHKLTHLKYICPLCDTKCNTLIDWFSHRFNHSKTYTGPVLSPYLTCKECPLTFPNQEIFLSHACIYAKKSSIIKEEDVNRSITSEINKNFMGSTEFNSYKQDFHLDTKYIAWCHKKRATRKRRNFNKDDFSHLIGVDRSEM